MRIIITDIVPSMRIKATQTIRKWTGLGLREAKECIDTAMSGVPSVLENIPEQGIKDFRKAGIHCHQDREHQLRLPLDAVQIMKDLVSTFMEEGRFKTAEFLMKALVSYERDE